MNKAINFKRPAITGKYLQRQEAMAQVCGSLFSFLQYKSTKIDKHNHYYEFIGFKMVNQYTGEVAHIFRVVRDTKNHNLWFVIQNPNSERQDVSAMGSIHEAASTIKFRLGL